MKEKELSSSIETLKSALRLDSYLERAHYDQKIENDGGTIVYAIDQSVVSAFFQPRRDAVDRNNKRGFASIFPGDSLEARESTQALGSLLIDHIFFKNSGSRKSARLLLIPDAGHEGIENSLGYFLRMASKSNSRNTEDSIAAEIERNKDKLVNFYNQMAQPEGADNLVSAFEKEFPEIHKAIADELSIFNLGERFAQYGKVDPFDWGWVSEDLEARGKEIGLPNIQNRQSDFNTAIEQYRSQLKKILVVRPDNPQDNAHLNMVSEILALNGVYGGEKTKFVLVTLATGLGANLEDYAWDRSADVGAKLARRGDAKHSAADLFIRHPLCFLSALEHADFGDDREFVRPSPWAEMLSNGLVTSGFDSERKRLGYQQASRVLEERVKELNGEKQAKLNSVLQGFLKEWRQFIAVVSQQANEQFLDQFRDTLDDVTRNGYKSAYQRAQAQFALNVGNVGLYLSAVFSKQKARSTPNTIIDCHDETNEFLQILQSSIKSANDLDIDDLDKFIHSNDNSQYFRFLVLSALFSQVNQFQTAKTFAQYATAAANDQYLEGNEITGREGYLLLSAFTRICATEGADFDVAKRYLEIARNRLRVDNQSLRRNGTEITPLRFDLEDYSREIAAALFRKRGKSFQRCISQMQVEEYSASMRNWSKLQLSPWEENIREYVEDRIYGNLLILLAHNVDFDADVQANRAYVQDHISRFCEYFPDSDLDSVRLNLEIRHEDYFLTKAYKLLLNSLLSETRGEIVKAQIVAKGLGLTPGDLQMSVELQATKYDKHRYRWLAQACDDLLSTKLQAVKSG